MLHNAASQRCRVTFVAVRYHVLDKDKPPMVETIKTLDMLEAKLLGRRVLPLLSPADTLALEKTNKTLQSCCDRYSHYAQKLAMHICIEVGPLRLQLNQNNRPRHVFKLAYDEEKAEIHSEMDGEVSLVTYAGLNEHVLTTVVRPHVAPLPRRQLLDYFLNKILKWVRVRHFLCVNADQDDVMLLIEKLNAFPWARSLEIVSFYFEPDRKLTLPVEEDFMKFFRTFQTIRVLLIHGLSSEGISTDFLAPLPKLRQFSMLGDAEFHLTSEGFRQFCKRGYEASLGVCPQLITDDIRWALHEMIAERLEVKGLFVVLIDDRQHHAILKEILGDDLICTREDPFTGIVRAKRCIKKTIQWSWCPQHLYVKRRKGWPRYHYEEDGWKLCVQKIGRYFVFKARQTHYMDNFNRDEKNYDDVMRLHENGRRYHLDIGSQLLFIFQNDEEHGTVDEPWREPKRVASKISNTTTKSCVRFLGVRYHCLDNDKPPFFESFKNLTELPVRVLTHGLLPYISAEDTLELEGVSTLFRDLIVTNTPLVNKFSVGVRIRSRGLLLELNRRIRFRRHFHLHYPVEDEIHRIEELNGIEVATYRHLDYPESQRTVDACGSRSSVSENRLLEHILDKVFARVTAKEIRIARCGDEELQIIAKTLLKHQRPMGINRSVLSERLGTFALVTRHIWNIKSGPFPSSQSLLEFAAGLPSAKKIDLEHYRQMSFRAGGEPFLPAETAVSIRVLNDLIFYPGRKMCFLFPLTKRYLNVSIHCLSHERGVGGETFFAAMTEKNEWQGVGLGRVLDLADGRRFFCDITEEKCFNNFDNCQVLHFSPAS